MVENNPIPAGKLPFNTNVPDLSIEEIREDFFDIWQKNITIVRQTRLYDNEAGNYGSDDEENVFEVDKEIYINIQGKGTDDYSREKYGIDTTSKSWHCYTLHTEDLKNNDRMLWNGTRFVISNLNQAYYNGERVFWEFDLIGIDKDNVFYNNAD